MNRKKTKPVSNLATVHNPNLLSKTLKLQRETHASYLIQDGLANYTGLIIDIVIQAVEELHNTYNNTPMVERDVKLKAHLTDIYDATKESYDFFNSIAKDKQFFLDLRDGAQQYFAPIFNDIFEGFEVIYRCTGVKHYKMCAMLSLVWSMIEIGRISAEGLHAAVARASKVSFSGEGIDQYKLVKIREKYIPIMDEYVPRYPKVLQPSIDALLKKLTDALHQSKFCVAAGRYALKYSPNFMDYFVKICRNAYGVKFTMQ